ncbi:hypothetical protein JOF34_001936 [Microbacterium amylolyticum]|uniref:Luciferase-like domain-containing protein n=1 Tax=Microbacterium amylolyticum TaxID=936337 RepID=A0ABS4ZJ81_9MICO|nr:LLM class flavin-dependent oxidoreductase [Microbacterium amylolyticum]MBP2437350.1 hypothetical protein [Microbacterium amylolyticum]
MQIQPQHHTSYAGIRDAAARLEDLGVDVLFNWDHFFTLSGDPDGTHFESWTMLAAWAEQTERIELGALVLSNELKGRDEDAVNALFDAGVRLFTLGVSGPDIDTDLVSRWLAWRDSKN